MHIAAAALLAVVLVFPAETPDQPPPQTGIEGAWASNSDNAVVISGTQTEQANPGTDNRAPENGSPGEPNYPVHEFNFESCLDDWNSARGCFRNTVEEEEPAEPDSEQPAAPEITITDLAQFAPEAISPLAEPDNVGIAGIPTNFVAASSVRTTSGTLFSAPISVRFTPVGYDFDYGDGTITSSASGGATWAALGQATFTPTATSHTYTQRGTYSASVAVRYTAEVDLGGGWFAVAGQLTTDGPPQAIVIYEANTALVARTCAEQPGAPGC